MENTVNLKSSIAWSDFKLNSDGMVPVIAQDYQTNEVLMLAYMNEEAFNTTLETGKMTYWSRSRNELWTKGLTSGHLQFVKSLTGIFIFHLFAGDSCFLKHLHCFVGKSAFCQGNCQVSHGLSGLLFQT